MKTSRIYACFVTSLMIGALLSSCVTDESTKKAETQQTKPIVTPPVTPPSPPPETPEQMAEKAARAAAQEELESIIALYNNGDYHGEIKRFSGPNDFLKPYKDLEIQALKYTAFSYCLIGKIALCKLQFERAFKLDRSFDLAKGEQNHPIWGKVFDRVKKSQSPQ
jgi:hypothetical protein